MCFDETPSDQPQCKCENDSMTGDWCDHFKCTVPCSQHGNCNDNPVEGLNEEYQLVFSFFFVNNHKTSRLIDRI